MLDTNFEYNALFYNDDKYKYRRYLEIKNKKYNEENDLTVVMMNPGSSKPKNIDENNNNNDFLNKFVEVHPDPTQSQIKKIMDACKFEYAKIINLSDIRDGNSASFYKKLRSDLSFLNHSIFSDNNEIYLKDYISPKSTFIFCWGVNKKLTPLTNLALFRIEKLFGINQQIYGLKPSKNQSGYYHPLPRTNKKKKKWVENIISQIKEDR